MATAQLDKKSWHPYFDRISKTLVNKQAEIEIASLDLGDQIAAEWLPMMGIVYEEQADTIEIALEGLDHLIHKPRDVFADYDMLGLASLEIIDQNGARQIVKLRDPLMLAPPSTPVTPPARPANATR